MQDSTEFITQKLSKVMLDPSLLLDTKERPYEKLKGDIYLPSSIFELPSQSVIELANIFGLYLTEEEIQSGYDTFKARLAAKIRWKPFYRIEFEAQIPEELRLNYDKLQKADIPDSAKSILSDEFVFLTTHSCLISRLKKPFKIFEKYEVFPLINLEKLVPPEWVQRISVMKDCANWVCFIVGIIELAFGASEPPISLTMTGTRLLIIDP